MFPNEVVSQHYTSDTNLENVKLFLQQACLSMLWASGFAVNKLLLNPSHSKSYEAKISLWLPAEYTITSLR